MKKAENTANSPRTLGVSVLCGLLITLLCMMGGAWAVYSGRVAAAFTPYAALACVAIGAFFCTFLASRLACRSRFLWGLASGGALFVALLAISFLWVGSPIQPLRVAQTGAALAALSCVGSFCGAGFRRKKHKKN